MVDDNTDTSKQGDEGVTDTTKTDTSSKGTLDANKSGDEQDVTKLFDDPRIWTHPRFKELNERAKRAKELEQQIHEAEEKKLEENKKFQELAEKRKVEAEDWKSKYQRSTIDSYIQAEASKLGVVDLDVVTKLVDRSTITLSETGQVIGAIEAVKQLVEAKPYLLGKQQSKIIGSGTQPGDNTGDPIRRFKLSQLQDPVYYRENQADIDKAFRAGMVEDDMAK